MSGNLAAVVDGGGFIGGHLVANLLSEGHRVRSRHVPVVIGTLVHVMRITYVLGIRPNFAKMAPMIGKLRNWFPDGGHTIIHAGQQCTPRLCSRHDRG
jgi:hypothetical protein